MFFKLNADQRLTNISIRLRRLVRSIFTVLPSSNSLDNFPLTFRPVVVQARMLGSTLISFVIWTTGNSTVQLTCSREGAVEEGLAS